MSPGGRIWTRVSHVFFLVFQVASLFASYILGYLCAVKMQSILVTHMVQQMTVDVHWFYC